MHKCVILLIFGNIKGSYNLNGRNMSEKIFRVIFKVVKSFIEILLIYGINYRQLNQIVKLAYVDIVMNNLSLHHFTRKQAINIIRTADLVGRCGFIINDLHRSRIAYAFIVILTRLITKNRITRYDGPVSVMNAFTPFEMAEMAEEAGVKKFTVNRHFPYRIGLVGTKIN